MFASDILPRFSDLSVIVVDPSCAWCARADCIGQSEHVVESNCEGWINFPHEFVKCPLAPRVSKVGACTHVTNTFDVNCTFTHAVQVVRLQTFTFCHRVIMYLSSWRSVLGENRIVLQSPSSKMSVLKACELNAGSSCCIQRPTQDQAETCTYQTIRRSHNTFANSSSMKGRVPQLHPREGSDVVLLESTINGVPIVVANSIKALNIGDTTASNDLSTSGQLRQFASSPLKTVSCTEHSSVNEVRVGDGSSTSLSLLSATLLSDFRFSALAPCCPCRKNVRSSCWTRVCHRFCIMDRRRLYHTELT